MRRTTWIDHCIRCFHGGSIVANPVWRQSFIVAMVLLLGTAGALAAPWEFVEPDAGRPDGSRQTDPGDGLDDSILITDGAEKSATGRPKGGDSADISRPSGSGDAPGVLQTLYETLGVDGWIAGRDAPGEVEPAGHESFGGFLQPYDACGAAPCPKWRGTLDALLLWQGNLASRPLYRDFDGESTGADALDANQLMPSLSAGPRYGILYQFDACWSVEGNYFRVTPFETSRVVEGNPELAEVDIAGFNDEGFDRVGAFADGEVQSAECNLRHRHCKSPTTWIAGFRWVQLDQNLLLQEDGLFDDPDFFADFLTRTGNDLYGGQIGFDTMVWNDCRGPIQVNVLGKAGVFANIAYQSIFYEDSDGEFAQLDESTTATSFFGELGVNATYRLTHWLGWRAGYTLFWASGVATPVGQLAANNFESGVARINTAGSVLLHGVTTGVEARW